MFAESVRTRILTIREQTFSSDIIEQIQMNIQERSCNGTAPPDWAFIMDVAFELGETLRRRFSGEWSLVGTHQLPFVINLAGRSDIKVNPLLVISNYWGKPQYSPYSIVGSFNRILKKIL